MLFIALSELIGVDDRVEWKVYFDVAVAHFVEGIEQLRPYLF
jgi:hypothetical protein